MTEKQLKTLLSYWQTHLNLLNWDIGIEFVQQNHLHEPNNVGECIAQLCDHTAQISILDPLVNQHDVEVAVVHECLHIMFCGTEPAQEQVAEAALFENGIDTSARAFVTLRREKKDPLPVDHEDIIWAAGLFEGEGCISVCREQGSYPLPRLTLCMTDYDVVLRFLYSVMGIGTIYGPRIPKNGDKPSWTWTANGYERCKAILSLFWSWLGQRRKARAIDIFTQYEDHIKKKVKLTSCDVSCCPNPNYIKYLCREHYNEWRRKEAKLAKTGTESISLRRKLRQLANIQRKEVSEEDLYALREKVREAILSLSEKEQEITCLYYGIDQLNRQTLDTIGKKYHQEGSSIRHIKTRSLKKLKQIGIQETDLLVIGCT